jgi:hypothetical protein
MKNKPVNGINKLIATEKPSAASHLLGYDSVSTDKTLLIFGRCSHINLHILWTGLTPIMDVEKDH